MGNIEKIIGFINSKRTKITAELHPKDRKAVVLKNIDFKRLSQISHMFGCSGYMASETVAVVTNVGIYK